MYDFYGIPKNFYIKLTVNRESHLTIVSKYKTAANAHLRRFYMKLKTTYY